MRRTAVRLCDGIWKPKPHMLPDMEKIREEGGVLLSERGEYSYTEADVHPELRWNKQGNSKIWFSPEDKLSGGFQADMLNESLVVGLDRTELEKRKKKMVRPITTQGGHGMTGSEFVDEMDNRGMGVHTHQFQARKRHISPEWELDRWNGKFDALKRVFTFDNPRYPYFLYNRLNDRIVMERKHYPIEITIKKNECTVWLTTTYAQAVSEFDFQLCHFLDKERTLMERPDWTPVVRKVRDDGTSTFEVHTPPLVSVEQVQQTTAKHFLRGLECDWTEKGNVLTVVKMLRSWYRVMDVVNSCLEMCEAVRQHPVQVTVHIHTVSISLPDTKEGRAVAIELDKLMMQHETYLTEVHSKIAAKGDGRNPKAHLADFQESPRSHFKKNPLGAGSGPMRKVFYEKPADYDNFVKRMAWGEVGYDEMVKRYPNTAFAKPSSNRPFKDKEEWERAKQVDAMRRGIKQKSESFLTGLQSKIRKNERSKKASLE